MPGIIPAGIGFMPAAGVGADIGCGALPGFIGFAPRGIPDGTVGGGCDITNFTFLKFLEKVNRRKRDTIKLNDYSSRVVR
jgi:hypothetical protein